MNQYARLIAAIVLGLPSAAQAQTTNCQWFGAVWTCNGTPARQSSGVQWDRGVVPDIAGNAMRSFEEGQRIGRERQAAQLEAERIAAETAYYNAQAIAALQTPSPGTGQVSAPSQTNEGYARTWLEAARPRMGLFPNFDKMVFNDKVPISTDTVMLMSSSPYAADIAYYLATHKAEAMAISKLPLLEAARAIDQIEVKAKAANPIAP